MACECCYRSRCTFGQITPSEAALKRHSLRASLQTQIWTASHVAKLHIPSPLECRWQRRNESPQPVYFGGPMSADVLKNLVCSCKGKSPCKKNHISASRKTLHVQIYASAKGQNGANMHKRIH